MVRVGRCRVLLGNEGALNWPNVSVCLCVCAGVGVWVVNEWVWRKSSNRERKEVWEEVTCSFKWKKLQNTEFIIHTCNTHTHTHTHTHTDTHQKIRIVIPQWIWYPWPEDITLNVQITHTPPPRPSVRLSVCSSVRVSDHGCGISPEPLNHFLPNLVCWCIIMRPCVMQNNWFSIFNVTAKACIIKVWLFLLYLLKCCSVWNQILFDTKVPNLSSGKIGLLHSRPRPQWRFKMSVNVCSDGIFWTTEHFVTKLGTVMQYYEPECCAEKLVHCRECQGHSEPECPIEKWDYCVQGQGHSKGEKCLWMFVQMISSEPQNILLPNMVWLCSIIGQSVMQKNWFTLFNVKVTGRAYIIKIWLFLLYLLNCWFVCNQAWFDSLLSNQWFVLYKYCIVQPAS